jgi:hypothetical protein
MLLNTATLAATDSMCITPRKLLKVIKTPGYHAGWVSSGKGMPLAVTPVRWAIRHSLTGGKAIRVASSASDWHRGGRRVRFLS